MAINDPLGDMLTRIRNAQQRRKMVVLTPSSKLRANVLDVLKREGYIRGFEKKTNERGLDEIEIQLKYNEGEPVIRQIKRVSTPGRRVYSAVADLPKVFNGLGISILSTPKGVLSDSEARNHKVGGEVLCQVF